MIDDGFEIAGKRILRGERKTIELPLARLYDYTELTMTIHVIRGYEDGPTLFISGAIHGDELTGTDVVRRILLDKRLKSLKGTLIAIPIVNIYGFNNKSRYLPDRRDLNRCFPGNSKGSLAARVADLFMKEVVHKCQFGIDFHSGALHRTNLPQIRTDIQDPVNRELAEVFGVPVILDSKLPDGSLREAAAAHGVNILLYEGGEALRLDERVVKLGIHGAFSIMSHIKMIEGPESANKSSSYLAKSSFWVRANQSGIIKFNRGLGSRVKEGGVLAIISDAFGNNRSKVMCPADGIIIGQSRLPLVNRGDAIYHVATFEDASTIKELGEELTDYTDHYF